MKHRENRIFSKNGKIVISIKKNPKFFEISEDETDFTVGIVSRNLANTSNFVKFRDSQKLHIFGGTEYQVP